jgi:hypothetical protein
MEIGVWSFNPLMQPSKSGTDVKESGNGGMFRAELHGQSRAGHSYTNLCLEKRRAFASWWKPFHVQKGFKLERVL